MERQKNNLYIWILVLSWNYIAIIELYAIFPAVKQEVRETAFSHFYFSLTNGLA